MSQQYALEISLPVAYASDQFIGSESNALVQGWITRWPEWPGNALIVRGEHGSGKTHLAHIWQQKTGAIFLPPDSGELPATAIIIDGLEHWHDETALFHLYNHAKLHSIPLLITTSNIPQPALPDLASRLKSLPVAEILPPDDALLTAVLIKQLGDRQLKISPDAIAYMLPRLPRSFENLASLVATLDNASLEENRTLSIPFIRSYL